MNQLINWSEGLFHAMPLSLLEIWGRFGYLVGIVLAICAYSGVTFRPAGGWGFARERQSWDSRALLAMGLTFVLIPVAGYIGSSIVLVPGAQTFESLKDLVVLTCLLLFGYPALIVVAPAYMLSDLVEGVPPAFMLDWLPGYFINPACFWIAYQLIGREPDFRRGRVWGWYALAALLFLVLEPQLWGYICSGKFTAEISYRQITPALFFTTGLTWVLGPLALLLGLPLARRCSMFWADIPGHVRHRLWRGKGWVWVSGTSAMVNTDSSRTEPGLPLRMFLATPFVALVLIMVGAVAFVTLRNGERAATVLASRLQQEISLTIKMTLDDYLDRAALHKDVPDPLVISALLHTTSIGDNGRILVLDRRGRVLASSLEVSQAHAMDNDPVGRAARTGLQSAPQRLANLVQPLSFRFDVVMAKPLSRETWLAYAVPYSGKGAVDWVVVSALPEADFLGPVRQGNSQAAMVFAVALFLSLVLAGVLASVVAGPIRRIARSARALAQGDLGQRVPAGGLDELGVLAHSFNDMAGQLQESMAHLQARVLEQAAMQDRLARTSERLQLASQAARIGIWEWDVVHNELIWDDAMYAIYGIEEGEFGAAFDAWVRCLHPEDRERATAEVSAALDNAQEFSSEFRIVWPDGSVHHILAGSQTIRDGAGQPQRMIGFNRDVTRDKVYEEELRRHRDHLEELVRDRTSALAAAVDQAESSNRAKSAFLANMSHELRTPLNAVIGFSRLLSQADNLSAAQRQDLAIINRSGSHLLTLINDVLDLSKIEAGKVQLTEETVDISTLCHDVIDMLRPRAEQGGLSLNLELDELAVCVRVDGAKLRQILINLLGNAIKFTREGSVLLRVEAAALPDGRLSLQFSVRDTGIGIAAEDQQRIFEPFVQMVTHATSAGTGLGLTLSRQYLQLLGSSLEVASTPGRGSVFRFALQLNTGDATLARHTPPGQVIGLPAGQRGRRILIADDTVESLLLTRRLLEPLGFCVEEAHDGLEAIEQTRLFGPELILMDYRMPLLDGVEATRQIRDDATLPQPLIIMLTASAFEEQRLAALATGADAFLSKPMEEAVFYGVLEKLLGLTFERASAVAPSASAPAAALSRGELQQLPASLRAALRTAARELSRSKVRDALIAAEIALDSGTGLRILTLADSFRYRELWDLLDEGSPD